MKLIEHYDPKLFGCTWIDSTTEGARILDVIRSIQARPGGYPLTAAAEPVISALEAFGDSLKLYKSVDKGFAQEIPLILCERKLSYRQETIEEIQYRVHHTRVTGRHPSASWVNEIPRRVPGVVNLEVPYIKALRTALVLTKGGHFLDSKRLVELVIRHDLAVSILSDTLVKLGLTAAGTTLAAAEAVASKKRHASPPVALVQADPRGQRLAKAWEVVKSHSRGATWEDCHRAAVDDLRELGVSETKIAEGFGLSRTAVALECGTLSDFKARKKATGWGAAAAMVRQLAG